MTSAPAARPGPAALPARTARTVDGAPPRQRTLILAPVETAPRCARATLTEALTLWGLPHLTEPGEAITSELVTNAITASTAAAPPGTQPRPVTLWVTVQDAELFIRVWDPDPAPPPGTPSLPGALEESGRGLLIVHALSSRWGCHPGPRGGKTVWAAIPVGATPSPAPGGDRTNGPTVPGGPRPEPEARAPGIAEETGRRRDHA